jgi:hypothetical protein
MLDFEAKSTQFGLDLKKVEAALIALSRKSLLIGIVKDEERQNKYIDNSALGFIHEFGAPEVGIPARPILFPTLNDNKEEIQDSLMLAASYAIQGDEEGVDKTLSSLGIFLVVRVKNRILNSIPPPLAARTLRKWITKTKRRIDYGTTPLKVTAQFLNSFTYALRNR